MSPKTRGLSFQEKENRHINKREHLFSPSVNLFNSAALGISGNDRIVSYRIVSCHVRSDQNGSDRIRSY